MNSYEQEIRYNLLKILSQESDISQREMAKQMGISLGKVNYCLSQLAKSGLIKVIRFKSAKDKKSYSYILTPRGLTEKAKLTVSFLKRKVSEYEKIRHQIRELAREVRPEELEDLSSIEKLDVLGRVR